MAVFAVIASRSPGCRSPRTRVSRCCES